VTPLLKIYQPEDYLGADLGPVMPCNLKHLLNNNECDFIIQTSPDCGFDLQDCINSTLCQSFRTQFANNCVLANKYQPIYPQCDINIQDFCEYN
jgi:hypothetical protein